MTFYRDPGFGASDADQITELAEVIQLVGERVKPALLRRFADLLFEYVRRGDPVLAFLGVLAEFQAWAEGATPQEVEKMFCACLWAMADHRQVDSAIWAGEEVVRLRALRTARLRGVA